MKLALVCSSLQCGGAERVLSILGNYWASSGIRVSLVTLGPTGDDFYQSHVELERIGLNLLAESNSLFEAFSNNLARLRKLRQAVLQICPDAIISFVDKANILTSLATIGLDVPLIVSERIDTSAHEIGSVWSKLRQIAYRRPRAIVVQTEQVKRQLEKYCKTSRLHVIPNPISPEILVETQTRHTKNVPPVITAMGRLVSQKGFDLLLHALAKVRNQFHLRILGEGPDRNNLVDLTASLGISQSVSFLGLVNNPAKYLIESDLFVLSSRYEGFPNALLEAMACNLPVISFDCPSGPREILAAGECGILITSGNTQEMAKAIDELLESESMREAYARKSRARALDFKVDSIAQQWMSLLSAYRASPERTEGKRAN
jgi:glycosyltransferase involved in cell wall biosynthesis